MKVEAQTTSKMRNASTTEQAKTIEKTVNSTIQIVN